MKGLRVVVVFVILLGPPAVAQTVTPQPATTLDSIRVFHALPASSCRHRIDAAHVEIEAFDVRIEVDTSPIPMPICGTPPPLSLTETLGRLPPGDYSLSISGAIDGVPFGPDTTTFSVEAGPFGDLVSPIPALGPWSLAVLVLVIGGAALVRFRSTG